MNTVLRFNEGYKSYILVVMIGIIAGIITRLSDYMPYDTLWSFSSIASAFGFWMVTTTCIIILSSSNINASINVLLYLSAMNCTFYILQYFLGQFIYQFSVDSVKWTLLLIYEVMAIVAAGISYILYFWNKDNMLSNILYALPLCGLGAETLGVIKFFLHTHTYLFQLIFNGVGFIALGLYFLRKVNSRTVYFFTIAIGSYFGYRLLYAGVV